MAQNSYQKVLKTKKATHYKVAINLKNNQCPKYVHISEDPFSHSDG
jgi:hypothetical protein